MIKRCFSDPSFVGRWFPLAGGAFFLWNYFGQLYRMWSQQTAAGQSLAGWIGLWAALWAYWHFYRVCAPQERVAIWTVGAELVVNAAVIATVFWFQRG